jgi:cyclase
MLRSRIIPCLLVKNHGLVKTIGFQEPKYVGDPINAVRIFNEKEVDELIVLDIDASALGREPDYKLIEQLAAECRMPLCYGGGVKTSDRAHRRARRGEGRTQLRRARTSAGHRRGRSQRRQPERGRRVRCEEEREQPL